MKSALRLFSEVFRSQDFECDVRVRRGLLNSYAYFLVVQV